MYFFYCLVKVRLLLSNNCLTVPLMLTAWCDFWLWNLIFTRNRLMYLWSHVWSCVFPNPTRCVSSMRPWTMPSAGCRTCFATLVGKHVCLGCKHAKLRTESWLNSLKLPVSCQSKFPKQKLFFFFNLTSLLPQILNLIWVWTAPIHFFFFDTYADIWGS